MMSGFIFFTMKNTIKLKYGEKLEQLLDRPGLLAILIKVAFLMDEKTGLVPASEFDEDNDPILHEEIKEMILMGLLKRDGDNLLIPDKKVIDVTLKRKPAKPTYYNELLKDVNRGEIDEEMLVCYDIAIAFYSRILDNLKFAKLRYHDVEQAKCGKWIETIRLMMEKDKVTRDQFMIVWKYLDKHSFWTPNVRSVPQLRGKKFENIYSQAIQKNGKHSEKRGTKVSGDFIQGLARKLQ